ITRHPLWDCLVVFDEYETRHCDSSFVLLTKRARRDGPPPARASAYLRKKNFSARFAELRELCGLRFCLRICFRQLPTQQLSQICRRAPHAHIKMPEQRVHCADFVKAHLVNQFLEHHRIVRPQIYSPLPIVESDRPRDNLLHLARVAPPHKPVIGHLPSALFDWQRVPVLVLTPATVHGIKTDVAMPGQLREQARDRKSTRLNSS